MDTMTTVEIDVEFTPDSPEEQASIESAVREAAEGDSFKAGKGLGASGFELTILAILGIRALVDLVMLIRREWRTGVIVDFEGEKVRVTKDPDLPRGEVIIFHKDGTKVTRKQNEIDGLGDLIAAAAKVSSK
nr:hypothetical protein [uncultured Roseibium sp.]